MFVIAKLNFGWKQFPVHLQCLFPEEKHWFSETSQSDTGFSFVNIKVFGLGVGENLFPLSLSAKHISFSL